MPEPIEGDGARGVTGLPLLGLSEGTGQFDFRAVRIAPVVSAPTTLTRASRPTTSSRGADT